jgi:hypothetical protein
MGLWDTAPSFNNPPNFNDLASVQKYLKENINKIARSLQEIDFVINGNMDSRNTREIGGYNVDLTELKSKNGTVGISSYNDPDPDVDDVRFWAGDVDKNAAPWKVTEEGKMYATGAEISTSDGYPKVVIDPNGNLIGAYLDADRYVTITPSYLGSPSIYFQSLLNSFIFSCNDTMSSIDSNKNVFITSTGDITLDQGTGKNINLRDFNSLFFTSPGTSLGDILGDIYDNLADLSDRITALGG